ncbi:hypothetical protein EV294_11279 [Paenibacillus sp. BK033]|nr:hypothetical protein EV294_11279 [Paenibacillus sp. BK033]
MNNAYLFCYSPAMFQFLRARGHRYICVGINERTGGRFWLYAKDDGLKRSLDDYTIVS